MRKLSSILAVATSLAVLAPTTAFAQSGATGPGLPVLVGESDSIDLGVRSDEARARDAAAVDAQQEVTNRSRKRGDRGVAATPDDLIAGASVYDSKGVELGTIRSVDGSTAVVETAAGAVGVPLEAFGKNRKGLMFAMTKAEFDTIVARAE